jgi:hypothetical protein
MAAEIPITVMSKRVPFLGSLAIEGANLTTATFKMEIRNNPGDTGTALVTLNGASAGIEGISCTYDAAYADPETGETFAASVILIQINETTMEGLSTGTPVDEPVEVHYDLHITPSGGLKFLAAYGTFTYAPGVTQ